MAMDADAGVGTNNDGVVGSAWFPVVMEKLVHLPWGVDSWSSEKAEPLSGSAVTKLLFLLRDFLPPDGPVPAISPTWDGGVQADWELGDLYLEVEIVPDGTIRCCFVDERGEGTTKDEFGFGDGQEDKLRTHIDAIVTAWSRRCMPIDFSASSDVVGDDCQVMRRVSRVQLRFDKSISGNRPTNGQLSVGPMTGITSCWLVGEANPKEVATDNDEEYLYVLHVSLLRKYGLDIVRDSENGGPGHCKIIGTRDLTKTEQRQLLRQVRWVKGYAPESVSNDKIVTFSVPQRVSRSSSRVSRVRCAIVKWARHLFFASIVLGIGGLLVASPMGKQMISDDWFTNWPVIVASISGLLLGGGLAAWTDGFTGRSARLSASIPVLALGLFYLVVVIFPWSYDEDVKNWLNTYLAAGGAIAGSALGVILAELRK